MRSSSRLPSAAARAVVGVLVGVCLVAATGCCGAGSTCADTTATDAPPQLDGAQEGAPQTSPGCDASEITQQNGDVCAVCASSQGSQTICGAPQTAECYTSQNPYGDSCQQCATADGEVLYDDCAVQASFDRCEPITPDPSSPVDAANSVCMACFDDSGRSTRTVCEPQSDECHTANDGDRSCRECTRDGLRVVLDCGPLAIDPQSCVAYENTLGRCVDCLSERGELLSHACTLFGEDDVFTSCVQRTDPGGVQCVECTDKNGTVLSTECAAAAPPASEFCQLLDYTSQTCLVCLDQNQTPYVASCVSTQCDDPTDPNTCAPLNACSFVDGDTPGELCRVCAEPNGPEVQCLDTNQVRCVTQAAAELDNTTPDGTCITCSDPSTGVEVYRDCNAGSSAPAPLLCAQTVAADGSSCTVCYEDATNAPRYSTCQQGSVCYVNDQRALTDAAGVGLGPVATCYRCGASTSSAAADFVSSCTLPQSCSAPDGLAPDQSPDQVCDPVFSLVIAPRACDNSWGDAVAAASEDDIVAMVSAAQSQHGLAVVYAGVLATSVASCDPGQCSTCARGDVWRVSVAASDAQLLRDSYGSLTTPCNADGDCPALTVCSADGSCS